MVAHLGVCIQKHYTLLHQNDTLLSVIWLSSKNTIRFLRPVNAEVTTYSLSPKASSFLETLAMHRDSMRWAIAVAQYKQAVQYNKNRHEVPEFTKGTKVLVNPHSLEWVDVKGVGTKLKQRWIGPFKVVWKINPNIYRLHMSDRYPGLPVFNIEHLQLYTESNAKWGECTVTKESGCQKVALEEYSVEAIIGHRRKKWGMEWLVRWEGYGPQFDTWEPTLCLRNAPLVLNEYKRAHGLWALTIGGRPSSKNVALVVYNGCQLFILG